VNVTYSCPACEQTIRSQFSATSTRLECARCGQSIDIPGKAATEQRITRCLVCPSTELFVRKDFPQRLGVALVILGFVASSIAWYNYQVLLTFAILFVTALVDLVLYVFMGQSLMCYRCGAQYRGVAEMDAHGAFDLETHERHRQMKARMKDTRVDTAAAQPASPDVVHAGEK
jgi:ribosomal protein S27E